ncbi:penicillin-binding protein 2 [bacterium]|nr:penicillin-binding protein 2 [bacterium]
MKRIPVLLFSTFLIAALLLGQLYFIQIVRTEEYRDRAEGQYNALSGLFDRGTIYFTEKNGSLVSAASLADGYILAIEPAKITDPEWVYEEIQAVIPALDKETFFEKASKTDDPYEEIARRVSEEEKKKIELIDIPGVGLYHERWRFYPMRNSGSHAVGFTGYGSAGATLTGQYGVERYYNDILDKNSGEAKQNLFVEIFSSFGEVFLGEQAIHGDVVLTIEPQIQHLLSRSVNDITKKWNSRQTGGIIMNPQTGALYAMAVSPDFDPNAIAAEKNLAVFNNPLIENVFEMGSVVKPLAMAAALDGGVITADTTYNDPSGSVVVGNAKISNFDGKARGDNISMQEVLSQSLNTGMVFVMKKMGRELFAKYMLAYDLGEETGIDLPGETYGLVDNLQSPRDVEHATAAFGQGIAITPLALTRALASLANGGVLPDPHLLKEIRYGAGLSKGYVPNGEGKRVLKESTSEEITRMLVTVVDDALLGGTVKLPHYSIAAKTGTAEISQGRGGGGYYEDRYLHSFFGYFPAYDPKFIVFLFTVEPVGERYASHTLTKPFMDIAKFLLAYYEIPPDR